jgi:hypothetical protein
MVTFGQFRYLLLGRFLRAAHPYQEPDAVVVLTPQLPDHACNLKTSF